MPDQRVFIIDFDISMSLELAKGDKRYTVHRLRMQLITCGESVSSIGRKGIHDPFVHRS